MFVSHKARISGEFDSQKGSHPTKVDRRPQILVRLNVESCVFQSYLVCILSKIGSFHWSKKSYKSKR